MKTSSEFRNIFKHSSLVVSADEFLQNIEKIVLDFVPNKMQLDAKIKLENLNIELKQNGSSYYDYYTNTVYVLQREILNPKAYVHEIFHALGTKVTDPKINIGLMEIRHNNVGDELTEIMLARALNEGSNTYWTAKALEKANIKDSPYDVASSYGFCTNIFASLVDLLGEEECKNAHFSGGLKQFFALVREKCNRTTDSKIIKLILSLDTYLSISQVNNWLGIDYSTDSRAVLTEAYKSLVDLYFFKYENQSNKLTLDNILSDFYLTDDNKLYFDKYIRPRLVRHLEKRIIKEYISKAQNSTHLDYKVINKAVMEIIAKAKNGEEINGNNLPEKLKCGEFYNYLLICVGFVDQNYEREGLKTNDIQRIITKALFEKSNNFMPQQREKRVQTVIDLLASRIAVRAGIEVSDELILDCLADSKKFHFYLMDSNPDYYKELYSKASGEVKFNNEILQKVALEVFTTRVERFKLKKMLSNHIDKQNFIDSLDSTNQNHFEQ